MNSRWFKEERELLKEEQDEAISDAAEVISHSVLVTEKLKRIIKEDIDSTYDNDEDVGREGWEQRALANVGARKALRKLLKLLP